MNRINQLFQRCQLEKRKVLVGFLTGGDPYRHDSFALFDAACGAGLDLLELGIPFSDATADGPVIQRANGRALESGATLSDCLQLGSDLRKKYPDIPIILFGYYHPLLSYGPKRFVDDALAAGLDGLLCVDLPFENFGEITDYIPAGSSFDLIRLISPTTTKPQMEKMLAQATGFVYVQSRPGVTGVQSESEPHKLDFIQTQTALIRSYTDLPAVVGFGISTPKQATEIAPYCEGVVVGSALIQIVEKHFDVKRKSFDLSSALEELSRFITLLKTGLLHSEDCIKGGMGGIN